MRYLLLMLFCMSTLSLSYGQRNSEFGIFAGMATYSGDVYSKKIDKIFQKDNFQPSFGIFIHQPIGRRIFLRGNAVYSRISGDDRLVQDNDRQFSFTSSITELSAQVEYEPFGLRRYRNIKFHHILSPFIFGGFGVAIVNSKPDFHGSTGAGITRDKHEIAKTKLVIPLGAGIRYDFSRRMSLGVEGSFRLPTTDFLDGISNSANPDDNDWYAMAGIRVAIKIGAFDTDEDGIPDSKDKCPSIIGMEEFNGCPDSDDDGVGDKDDKCPDEAGYSYTYGCPDKDRDGVYDDIDSCPEEKGLAKFGGCPDSDGDNISDLDDDCPDIAGYPEYYGCPEANMAKQHDGGGSNSTNPIADSLKIKRAVALESSYTKYRTIEEAQNYLNHIKHKMRFFKNTAQLRPQSKGYLDEIVMIMKAYPDWSIKIGAYTDNSGKRSDNLRLSIRRARACHAFLISHGIDGSRVTYKGFGEAYPEVSNSTPEGRIKNQRVEFKMH